MRKKCDNLYMHYILYLRRQKCTETHFFVVNMLKNVDALKKKIIFNRMVKDGEKQIYFENYEFESKY